MKLILTNDDGIDAPGLAVLYDILKRIGPTVIVAPEEPQSGIGHRVTTRSPLKVRELEANRFAVDGTPADCSRIALKKIAPDAAWLFAGINPGANLGSDVYNSGTVAAAREAAILGCRAMAISQYIAKDCTIEWPITGRHIAPVIRLLIKKSLSIGYYWNLNLPHPLSATAKLSHRFCGLDVNPHKYDFRKDGDSYHYVGTIHERPRESGKDVAVCFGGQISITRLGI